MRKKNYQYDMFFNKNAPTLDLHGETRESASYLVKQFINDYHKLILEKGTNKIF